MWVGSSQDAFRVTHVDVSLVTDFRGDSARGGLCAGVDLLVFGVFSAFAE